MSDPTTIFGADLHFWEAFSTTGSGAAFVWNDSTANAFNAGQLVGTGFGTSTTTDGHLSVTFDGSSSLFNGTPFRDVFAGLVWFCCFKADASNALDARAFDKGADANFTPGVGGSPVAKFVTGTFSVSASADYRDGNWHALVVVGDTSSGGTLKMYIDGSLVGTGTGYTGVSSGGDGVSIASTFSHTNLFKGQLASLGAASNDSTNYSSTQISDLNAYLVALITSGAPPPYTASSLRPRPTDNTQRIASSGGDVLRDIARKRDDGTIIKTQVMKLVGLDDELVSDVHPLATRGRVVAAKLDEILAFGWRAIEGLSRPMAPAGGATRASSAAPPFAPTDIAGLLLWLIPTAGITQSGGTVSEWDDRSGSGDTNRNLIQATGANQPTYNASDADYGGTPSLSVAGTQWMNSASWTGGPFAAPYTIYLAAKVLGPSIGNILSDGLGSAAVINNNGTSFGWDATDSNLYNASTSIVASTPAVVGVVFDNGGSIYVSDSQTAAGTAAAGAVASLGALTFGAFTNGGSSAATGSAAEILVYSGAHDAATRQKIMKYIGARTGLAAT